MENNPILSILIPTYNGTTKYLSDVLEYLIKGINLCDNNEIEVIVSNNASTDDTENLLCRYEKYPFIKHFTNTNNVGFARNIVLLMDNYANGEYGWVVGDDDFINPYSLPYIISFLKKGDIDYLSMGFKIIRNKEEIDFDDEPPMELSYGSYSAVLEKGDKGNTLGTFMSTAIFRLAQTKRISKTNITDKFDTFQSVFPNGYINATAFHDKKCGRIDDIVVYPIVHRKEWATDNNSYMIATRIFPELYQYILSLGVKKRELKKTYSRILFAGLLVCYRRLKLRETIDKRLMLIFGKSLLNPYVYYYVAKALFLKNK